VLGGPAGAAQGMAANVGDRPFVYLSTPVDVGLDVARALETRDPAHAESAVAAVVRARQSRAMSIEATSQFLASLGALDPAFELIDRYFFPATGHAGSAAASAADRPRDRATRFLFAQSTRPLRADRRFAALLDALGLEAYWRAARVTPDFRFRTG
jgi:hypothetical protein